jgi:hypothetical protein
LLSSRRIRLHLYKIAGVARWRSDYQMRSQPLRVAIRSSYSFNPIDFDDLPASQRIRCRLAALTLLYSVDIRHSFLCNSISKPCPQLYRSLADPGRLLFGIGPDLSLSRVINERSSTHSPAKLHQPNPLTVNDYLDKTRPSCAHHVRIKRNSHPNLARSSHTPFIASLCEPHRFYSRLAPFFL